MLRNRIMVAAGLCALVVGACSGCSGEDAAAGGDASAGDLPEYESLEDARQAVFDHLDCREDPPEPTFVGGPDGPIPSESVKCTNTVELFYFESQEARDGAYAMMADTTESGKSVYFAEGRNFFVIDFSEVGVGGEAPEPLDLSVLSEPLGTQFTEVS